MKRVPVVVGGVSYPSLRQFLREISNGDELLHNRLKTLLFTSRWSPEAVLKVAKNPEQRYAGVVASAWSKHHRRPYFNGRRSD